MIDVICELEDEHYVVKNIPQLVVHHSPDGFSWGFSGSGPADLALNILEVALFSIHWHGPRQKCWRGSCFQRAWKWHQDFKREFIAPMDKQGGVISGKEVIDWLNQHE